MACMQLCVLLDVVWIDERHLHTGMTSLLATSHRRVSLTDWSGITLMRSRGVMRAFAFDGDFARQGFELVPSDTTRLA